MVKGGHLTSRETIIAMYHLLEHTEDWRLTSNVGGKGRAKEDMMG